MTVNTTHIASLVEQEVPGMIYVKLRSADSIWETALAFLMMKSPYMSSHFGGSDKASGAPFETCLYSDDIFSQERSLSQWCCENWRCRVLYPISGDAPCKTSTRPRVQPPHMFKPRSRHLPLYSLVTLRGTSRFFSSSLKLNRTVVSVALFSSPRKLLSLRLCKSRT